MKNRKARSEGFTLIEMMIVVALIGLLSVVAIPHWVRARTTSQTNACINNLRQIAGATQQWALDNRQGSGASVQPEEVLPYMKSAVVCPAGGTNDTFGGTYSVTYVSNAPICRIVPTVHILTPDTTQ
jgi:prepilin-type N-terminal cleavage/methylation domain-containing protein